MQEIEQRIQALEHDSIRGASDITKEAILLLAQAAIICAEKSDWPNNLVQIKQRLQNAKPAMACVINGVEQVYQILRPLPCYEIFSSASILATNQIRQFQQAAQKALIRCTELIPNDSQVLTCSSSSSVLSAAHKVHRVVIFEPNTQNSNSWGQQMARILGENDIASEVVSQLDDNLLSIIDCAVIGCDAITPKFVVNGTPSLEMAQRIHKKLPLYVLGQRLKKIDDISFYDGFDQIPLELITEVITEE